MSGGYVIRRHRCDLPIPDVAGDIWRCECGRLWRAVGATRWVQLTWLERTLRGLP